MATFLADLQDGPAALKDPVGKAARPPGEVNEVGSAVVPRNQLGAAVIEMGPLHIEIPQSLLDAIAERAAVRVAEQLAPDPSPYMSVEEAASYLCCRPKRIYDLCSQRRLPFLKDGSRTLLRRSDLDAYLEVKP